MTKVKITKLKTKLKEELMIHPAKKSPKFFATFSAKLASGNIDSLATLKKTREDDLNCLKLKK